MIRLTLRSIWNRKWRFFLIIIVGVISLVMLSLSIYIYENSVYCKKVVSSSLKSGVDHSCILAITSESSDTADFGDSNYMEFKNKISSIDGITSSGEMDYNEGLEDSTLAKRQCKLTGRDDGLLHYGFIEKTAINFYNIPLSEGEIQTVMPDDQNIHYVYLGSDYKKYYKVGDVIADDGKEIVNEGNKSKIVSIKRKYIIKGFIKDNAKFVYPDTLTTPNPFVDDKCYETLTSTGVIVEFSVGNVSNVQFITWSSDKHFNDVKVKIDELASRYGYSTQYVKVKQLLKEKELSNREINQRIFNILGIVISVTVIMMICIQLSAIINNTSEYGILYANGYTTKNIAMMIIIEAFIKIAFASVISLFLVKYILIKIFFIIPNENEVFHEIFNKYVISGNVLSALLIGVVSVIVPLLIIRYKKPVELIGGNDT